MMDREKVIKGLECCIIHVSCAADGGCPYKSQADANCLDTAIKDAIALLNAQEPVVIAPETMGVMSRRPVWLETKNGRVYNGYVLVYEVQYGMGISGVTDKRLGIADPSGRMHWLKMCDCGVTWRCWTSRPTDEQREAVKWDD